MARILVIDDDKAIRNLIHTFLTKKGHEVFLAGDGETGLSMFNRVRPMITILDLRMPGLDGLEVLRRLRAIDSRSIVIMLTGYGPDEVKAKAMALGANEFLKKDFTAYELGEVLRRTIDRLMRIPPGTAA